MNEQIAETMFALIRQTVCGAKVDEQVKTSITPERLPQLYTLSKSHDMAHIVAQGLSELGMLAEDSISQKFQKQQMLSVYRYQQLKYETEQICRVLEESKIPFIPLKGAVMREYYASPWMRTSCDVDVLVHEEDLDRAVRALEDQLSYQYKGKGSHDVSLFSQGGLHLEMHYDTVEEGLANNAQKLLSSIWDHTTPKASFRYWLELTDAMFYFYHIAHIAKHFEVGGCGVRPLLDLWILDHCVEHDATERCVLLERGGLPTFAKACRTLSEVWFGETAHTPLTEHMQEYILFGGVYGNVDNRVAIEQTKKGGKFRYAMSRIFLSYDKLKFSYPILQKHRWLTPVMEVRRWFRLIFKGRLKSSVHELSLNQNMSQEQITKTADLFSQLELR